MDNIISNREDIRKWMTLGKTVLFQKDASKGNAADNYRPISFLSLMWNLITGTIAESIYNSFDLNDKLPIEQKRYRKKSRGTENQLLIGKTILRDCKKSYKNLGMAWSDY